jgi:hypothetical protein
MMRGEKKSKVPHMSKRKKRKKRKKTKKKNNKKESNNNLLWFSSCLRIFQGLQDQDPYSFSNHVQSDNEDFIGASGSFFAICTCPPI